MKWKFCLLGILELIVALGAIPGGLSMIIHPDGSGLGMSINALNNSPFTDFFIPGLFLLIVNGVAFVWAAYLSLKRKPLAGSLGMMLGVFLMAWILIQVYFIGYASLLQPLMFGIGVIVSGLGWLIARTKEGAPGNKRLPV